MLSFYFIPLIRADHILGMLSVYLSIGSCPSVDLLSPPSQSVHISQKASLHLSQAARRTRYLFYFLPFLGALTIYVSIYIGVCLYLSVDMSFFLSKSLHASQQKSFSSISVSDVQRFGSLSLFNRCRFLLLPFCSKLLNLSLCSYLFLNFSESIFSSVHVYLFMSISRSVFIPSQILHSSEYIYLLVVSRHLCFFFCLFESVHVYH
ncbi:unnamed protein product [Acanthosepion pharaonis]|uniref:Uncharacterized protein n=1 Tax=Acanthosepion pharaonis TaxID=158019 RepID=A0A812AR63_ACAPH|nr:unnamed protein product [Sepia pharaonis]